MSAQEPRPEQAAYTEDTKPDAQPARAKKRRWLLTILALFLLLDICAAGVLIHVIRSGRQESADLRDAQAHKAGATQEMTQEERDELVAIALGEAHSSVTLRSEMLAQDGRAEIYLANAEQSPCAVEVELMLMDSREVVLRTGVVDPGWYLKTAPLDEPLSPGEYHCLARCLFYTTDDNAYLGTTVRQVLLTVR